MGEKRVAFNAGIIGTGMALPDRILTNAELEKIVDTSDEWIVSRTGIRQRTIASENESTSTFAVRAAREALERARVKAEELDLLICATVTPDSPLPAVSCTIQAELGASNAAAFDISAACTGFIYALSIADNFIKTGAAEKVLVIGAEVLSKWADWTDRATCVIFADGAGAAVVGRVPEGRGILASVIKSDGNFTGVLNIPAGGTKIPFSQKVLDERSHYIKMRGNELFKVAIRNMALSSKQVLKEAGYGTEDVDLVIPHQANQRITDAVAERLNIKDDRMYSNIDRIGNSSSATIPIGLHENVVSGRLKEGDLVLLTAFGGGVTWGSLLMRL
jgi:3-oxoacyl-[acyl-carrier-protein] synthase-3